MVRGTLPLLFVSVTVCAGVATPTAWVPNATGSGLAASGPVSIAWAVGPPGTTRTASAATSVRTMNARRMAVLRVRG